MGTKTCKTCGEEKSLDDFYGRLNNCKECHRTYMRKRRAVNPEQAREYDRRKAPQWRERKREYQRQHPDQVRGVQRRWAAKNRHKTRAYWQFHKALKDGRIEKQPCEVCGEADVHGHHDDYDKPLEVRWLCPVHHGETRREPVNG